MLHYYSAAPERLFGKQIPVPGGVNVTFAEPLGVVGVIVPWNFPMPIAGWGFAPALAAGNTVVLKPAELTPLTALRLAELALGGGHPRGRVPGAARQGSVVGQRFVDHPAVRKVVFTGSTEVGKQIMAGCADQMKRVTLELGGKNANIVFADADLEKAAAASAPYGVFDNAGQDCCARSRILVQAASTTGSWSCSNRPSGASSSATRRRGDRDGAADLRRPPGQCPVLCDDDAPVAFRGSAPDGPATGSRRPCPAAGRRPTASSPRRCSGRSSRCAVRGRGRRDALANATEYGLSGSIWTSDVGRALRVSRAVEAGNLSVNSHSSVRYWTPFGGFKQSGLGRELGPGRGRAFTETKNVFINTED